MTRLPKYLTTAACLLVGTSALAQTGAGHSGAGQTATDGARSADTITCADIVSMDSAVVPGVLYFVAGYRQGSQTGMNATGTTGTNGAQSMTDTGTGNSASTDSSASTGTTGDTSASAMTGTTDQSADTSGAADTTMDSSAASGDSANSTMSDTGSASASADDAMNANDQMRVMRVTGLYEIPVEKIMTVCKDTPDDNLGDVVRQNAQEDASTSN